MVLGVARVRKVQVDAARKPIFCHQPPQRALAVQQVHARARLLAEHRLFARQLCLDSCGVVCVVLQRRGQLAQGVQGGGRTAHQRRDLSVHVGRGGLAVDGRLERGDVAGMRCLRLVGARGRGAQQVVAQRARVRLQGQLPVDAADVRRVRRLRLVGGGGRGAEEVGGERARVGLRRDAALERRDVAGVGCLRLVGARGRGAQQVVAQRARVRLQGQLPVDAADVCRVCRLCCVSRGGVGEGKVLRQAARQGALGDGRVERGHCGRVADDGLVGAGGRGAQQVGRQLRVHLALREARARDAQDGAVVLERGAEAAQEVQVPHDGQGGVGHHQRVRDVALPRGRALQVDELDAGAAAAASAARQDGVHAALHGAQRRGRGVGGERAAQARGAELRGHVAL